MSLDLLNKREIEEKKNPHYDGMFVRSKRVLPPPKSNENESDSNLSLRKHTKMLINRMIESSEYREFLQERNVNVNAEAINKLIRAHESGQVVKFNELIFAIQRHKDDNFDHTKIKVEKGHNAFLKTSLKENPNESLVPVAKGDSKL